MSVSGELPNPFFRKSPYWASCFPISRASLATATRNTGCIESFKSNVLTTFFNVRNGLLTIDRRSIVSLLKFQDSINIIPHWGKALVSSDKFFGVPDRWHFLFYILQKNANHGNQIFIASLLSALSENKYKLAIYYFDVTA